MWLQVLPDADDLPLSKLSAQAIGVIVMVGLILWFLFKVVDTQHDTIKRLIAKIGRNTEEED